MERMNIERLKLANAIVYLIRNVNRVNKTLLMKLLYEIEFRHIRKIGLPVFGLKYYTWDRGPVPKELFDEISNSQTSTGFEDFFKLIPIKSIEDDDYKEFKFISNKKPDLQYFSPSEQEILENVALMYKEASASMATIISHEKGKPWKTTVQSQGMYNEIPYELTFEEEGLDQNDLEVAKERLNNWYLIEKNYPRAKDYC